VKLLEQATWNTYLCAHAKADIDDPIVKYGLDSVVGMGVLVGCTTAIPIEVVTFRRMHLGGISAANTDGVVVSGGVAVGALERSQYDAFTYRKEAYLRCKRCKKHQSCRS
jgi:hypothetical protein